MAVSLIMSKADLSYLRSGTFELRVTSGLLDSTPEKRGCVSNNVEGWPFLFEVWNLRAQKNCLQLVHGATLQTGLSFFNSEIIRSDTEYRKRFWRKFPSTDSCAGFESQFGQGRPLTVPSGEITVTEWKRN